MSCCAPAGEHAPDLDDFKIRPDPGVAEWHYTQPRRHRCQPGGPATERRFVHFPERATAAGRPGLAAGLLGLIGAPHVTAEQMRGWLPDWRAAFTALPAERAPARLHPHRLLYYYRAIETLLHDSQNFHAALWPLLRTWTSLVQLMPDQKTVSDPWYNACQQLELFGPGFGERLEALDAYLDTVEDTLEAWAARSGA
jgi:hypothetical protein